MTLNKQALREAAEKATSGQWEMEQENIWYTDAEGYTKHLMYVQQGDDVDDRQDHYNTAFIATANPATVLALLDELEAAEKRIAELEAKLANPVLLPKTNGYWTEQEKAYEDAITLAKRQVRLAGFSVEDM